jgi:hypothetical protein
VFVRFGNVFVTLALVAVLGGQWAFLQTVAWTTMLADNLQNNSFHAAVTKTFDGNYPCPLCRAIAAGKQSEKKNAFAVAQKMEFPLCKETIVLIAPSRLEIFPSANSSFKSVLQKPPTPPPRGLFI